MFLKDQNILFRILCSFQGAPIVHCHDGGGRTGAFLAVEANLNLMDRKELIDGRINSN